MSDKQKKEGDLISSIVAENRIFLLRLKLSQAEQKLSEEKTKNRDLQRKSSSYLIELRSFQDELKRKNQIIKDLQQDADTLYNNLRKKDKISQQVILSEDIKQKNAMIKELQRANKLLQSQIVMVQDQAAKKQEQLSLALQEAETLRSKLTETENFRRLIEQKSLALSSFNNRIKQLEQELSISDGSNRQLLLKVKDLTDELAHMKLQLKQKEQEIKERDSYYPLLMELEGKEKS